MSTPDIASFTDKITGRAPAEADLQRFFAVTTPSVHQMILTLERARLHQAHPWIGPQHRATHPSAGTQALPVLRGAQPVKITVQRY